ncbi:MAG TPA: hypothetical protein DDW45_04995 [Gammaproteobacteria bacterium]|nr:hypothetical protein [Gammaproteobacteria bacterium]
MKTKAEIEFIDTATHKLASARAMAMLIDTDDFADNMDSNQRYAYALVLIELIDWVDDAIQNS